MTERPRRSPVTSPGCAAGATDVSRRTVPCPPRRPVAEGVPVGLLDLADRLRPDVASLTHLTGTAPTLLTGDNPRAAAHLAAEVGIEDIRAGLLPRHKVDAVGELERVRREALVIGDGVDDAPALAPAHTG